MTSMAEQELSAGALGATSGRIASMDLGTALDPFADAGLLASGRVNLIALDAIVDRLGPRWVLRCDQVHEHADRTIRRHLQSRGFHVRVSDTDFLICQPELGRFSGQASCLQMLREILTHFIGDGELATAGVLQVTKVSPTEIQGSRVNAYEVEQGERTERADNKPQAPGLRRWTPFVASDGRELSVTCTLEPVYELRSFGRIGYRMVRRVQAVSSGEVLTAAMLRALPPGDILRVDLATVAHGLNRIEAADEDKRQPSLIIPVSFTSVTSQRGRTEIARLLVDIRNRVDRGVICQIGDVEGVPECSLNQVITHIRPFCLFVIAHLEPGVSTTTLDRLRRSALQGVSVDCPPPRSEAELLRWMETTLKAVRRVVRSALVYNLASPRHAAFAAQLGATHASVIEEQDK